MPTDSVAFQAVLKLRLFVDKLSHGKYDGLYEFCLIVLGSYSICIIDARELLSR